MTRLHQGKTFQQLLETVERVDPASPKYMKKVLFSERRSNNNYEATVLHLECGHERVMDYGIRAQVARCWECPKLDEENAGMSTCPVCSRKWLVTPMDDCCMPACGCYGLDTSPSNPSRLCENCGISHYFSCKSKPCETCSSEREITVRGSESDHTERIPCPDCRRKI